ncbi:MAG: phosphoadenylyl-sulfate reductase [Phreatobacter sp.]|uniref:phosphoadenylyl-sulfate reductase n=1 Tax=Phreatobacter sp. TaxID=1966341 RepID=UPI001A42D22C|nr:phosphoadenylyl-sulfate reductase [Phreatobacter sp.]MBL8570666.1 phosphoadenylyl-sulfate reductase [Phreatobacter sp.]
MPRLDLSRARPEPLAALSEEAAALERFHGGREPAALVELALSHLFAGRIALVSSFGAESAVLLHMAAEVDRHVPVIFVDTGRHFRETLGYRDALVTRLGLTDVRSVGPSADEARVRDPWLALAEQNPDACCGFRKVAPLARALEPFAAWMSGRKRFQAETRSSLDVFEAEGARIKVNPLAGWGAAEIAAYAEAHDLPPHPLVAERYASIGCAPCTSRVASDEDVRAGRWRGTAKTECGIHRPAAATAGY